MAMPASRPPPAARQPVPGRPQPNEVDWRRIERALERRGRYRYVRPAVEADDNGYRIVSPCCSRNVDAEGGSIDIARLAYDEAASCWRIYSKDHHTPAWVPRAQGRLHELLALLNADPQRIFWQ